jgi:hypothetical protein
LPKERRHIRAEAHNLRAVVTGFAILAGLVPLRALAGAIAIGGSGFRRRADGCDLFGGGRTTLPTWTVFAAGPIFPPGLFLAGLFLAGLFWAGRALGGL